MPTNFMAIDQGLPRFTGEESLEQRVKMLQDYQYQLVEQLRYALQNLDTRNMNMDAMGEWGGTLTEPLYASLTDEDGNMLSLAATAKELSAQISDQNGKIAQISADAAGLSARLWDTETGAITQLQAKAGELSASVGELAEGQTKMVTFDAQNGLMVYDEDGDAVKIDGEKVVAGKLIGAEVVLNSGKKEIGTMYMRDAETADYALELSSNYALSLTAWRGNIYMESWEQEEVGGPFFFVGYATNRYEANVPVCQTGRGALVLSGDETDEDGKVTRRGSYGYNMPGDREGVQGQVYILLE